MIAYRCHKLPPSAENSEMAKKYLITMGDITTSPIYRDSYLLYYEVSAGNITMEDTVNVYIGHNISNYRYIVANTLFNSPVQIPDTITSLDSAFYNSAFNRSLNLPVVSGHQVTVNSMLRNAKYFNSPVNFIGEYNNFDDCFYGCSNLNSPIQIRLSDNISLVNLNSMLSSCANFNSEVILPSNISSARGLFYGCSKFNRSVNLHFSPNTTMANISSMFADCTSFNCPVVLNSFNGFYNYRGMFHGCSNFNQPISLGKAYDYSQMFERCINFNTPITIPNSNTTYDASYMFANCFNFNSKIIFGDMEYNSSRGNFQYALNNCTNFNQEITIPKYAKNLVAMFDNCSNFGNTIYVRSTDIQNVTNMLHDTPHNKRIDLYFNSSMDSVFRRSGSTSILGRDVVWTNTDYGFYNSLFNIYCHNNYVIV